MTANLLITPEEIAGDEVSVEGDAYRHLFRALRLAVGDPVRAVDGRGRARAAEVTAVDGRRGQLRLGRDLPSLEPDLEITLAVAAPRKSRASWMVEKATELGVVAVRFVSFARSERSPGTGTRKRFLRVSRAAVEQCGRSRLPEISMDHEPEEIEAWIGKHDETWWLDADGEGPPRRSGSSTRALLLVGPEGGWEPEERRHFREWGLPCASLGPTTLRIETAAVTASALLLAAP